MHYAPYAAQNTRSEAEKKLPDYVREQLDWARSGHNPKYPHEKLSFAECQRFVRLWLSKDDPGYI